jgi:hypothetical protein
MQKEKLTILAIFAMVVAATAGFRLLQSNGAGPATAPSATRPAAHGGRAIGQVTAQVRGKADRQPLTPRKASKILQFKGISLQLQNSDPDNPYEKYIDEIAATGANTLALVIPAYQENASSASMFVDARKTPPDRRIQELISRAHDKGMQVVMMPIVLLENPRAGEWRGKIAPDDWDAWWARYGDYILHYARLAEASKAEALIIGSELISTEKHLGRWQDLIARVREAFSGLLTYSANWDHYDVPTWWKELDMIGMNTYYDMQTGEHPTVEQLVEAWKPIKERILQWRKEVGLPLLFTEVGWPNQVTCANEGWNYYAAVDKPDPAAQANCFEAFFRTWINEPDVAGILVWEWRNHPGMSGGPEDTSYIPCGKPAEAVIEKFFKNAAPKRFATSMPRDDSPQKAKNLSQEQSVEH